MNTPAKRVLAAINGTLWGHYEHQLTMSAKTIARAIFESLPAPVKELMEQFEGLTLAGGYIRDKINGVTPGDLDFWLCAVGVRNWEYVIEELHKSFVDVFGEAVESKHAFTYRYIGIDIQLMKREESSRPDQERSHTMNLTYQQLIFSTADEEAYLFSGEKSLNLNAICTAATETVMPTGNYRVIDGEFFRVEEGSLPIGGSKKAHCPSVELESPVRVGPGIQEEVEVCEYILKKHLTEFSRVVFSS